ncbi:T-complex protein 1 subunit eta [Geosmithia morbida]|uniref:T-complex protein 1 subunit eta n=1 Tax=Geosmithia morbida TaxID=1094350 RepID=A0A9P4YTB8_9HYPO|nr:T-complex protein 1 subunit eta [Geosmithia morbida]KAF4121404.1 T-complex protein 1 subunit eta [Geosmithia morbida]
MLKSTYTPTSLPPLAPGWTEHKAPTGHTYYYNAATKESTYKRPAAAPVKAQHQALPGYPTYGNFPSLSDPKVANAYLAQFNNQGSSQPRGGGHQRGRGRGGMDGGRPRPQPVDKPVRKEAIPGFEPWIIVYTKYSRRFVHDPAKKTSYWRIPEKLMPGILELDKARIRGKVFDEAPEKKNDAGEGENDKGDDSEYEEVELQAMGEDYGLEPGDYDDGHMDEWPEGASGVAFSEEDAKLLFKDMLEDFGVSPYSPWEKLMEEGKVVEDARYTALTTTKARRDCWDEWCRERIAALKEERARQEKKDPRVAYMAFLGEKASPKLYWPEFRRKYKREPPMKDHNLSDKDREKAYRDLVSRLKLPLTTRKADLTALLKAQPLHVLNNRSLAKGLPTQLLVDARYAALEPAARDPLVEAYVQSLPPPPEDLDNAQAAEEERKKRQRREKALEERSRAADEAKRQHERDIARSKARLREGERELEMAMRVGKDGLRSHFVNDKPLQ